MKPTTESKNKLDLNISFTTSKTPTMNDEETQEEYQKSPGVVLRLTLI